LEKYLYVLRATFQRSSEPMDAWVEGIVHSFLARKPG